MYILSRMGNSRQALGLIIESRRDVPRAIEFVRRQADDDLWAELIAWALRAPETTGGGALGAVGMGARKGWGRWGWGRGGVVQGGAACHGQV